MALYSRVTTWVSGQILTAAALNGEFDNILDHADAQYVVGGSADVTAMQVVVDPNPAGTPSLAASVLGEIHRLRFMIKLISNQAQWYIDPVGSLSNGGIVTANYAALSITTAAINTGAVTMPKITSIDGVSGSSGSFTTSSTTYVDVSNLNVTLTFSGTKRVEMKLMPTGTSGSSIGLADSLRGVEGFIRLLKDSVDIGSVRMALSTDIADTTAILVNPPSGVCFFDAPTAGSHNYQIQMKVTAGNAPVGSVTNCVLWVREVP